MRISLPFPPKVLSPNARPHFFEKARAAKKYKLDCGFLLSPHRFKLAGRDTFSVRFCPPNNNRRDLDTAIASAKHLFDALAETCGVDDSQFKLTFSFGDVVDGGAVIVEAA